LRRVDAQCLRQRVDRFVELKQLPVRSTEIRARSWIIRVGRKQGTIVGDRLLVTLQRGIVGAENVPAFARPERRGQLYRFLQIDHQMLPVAEAVITSGGVLIGRREFLVELDGPEKERERSRELPFVEQAPSECELLDRFERARGHRL